MTPLLISLLCSLLALLKDAPENGQLKKRRILGSQLKSGNWNSEKKRIWLLRTRLSSLVAENRNKHDVWWHRHFSSHFCRICIRAFTIVLKCHKCMLPATATMYSMKSLVDHKFNILKIWPAVVTNMTLRNLKAATEEIIQIKGLK